MRITETSLLMLYREAIAAYRKKNTKHLVS